MPSNSNIWKIGLFKKLSKTEVECLECKKTLKISEGSPSGAIKHLNTIHLGTEYAKKFAELEKMKKEGGRGEMEKHILITSGGFFILI